MLGGLLTGGPILRKKEPTLRTSATLPVRIWEECARIADESSTKKDRYTRDEVIADFLDWAIREFRARQRLSKKTSGTEKTG